MPPLHLPPLHRHSTTIILEMIFLLVLLSVQVGVRVRVRAMTRVRVRNQYNYSNYYLNNDQLKKYLNHIKLNFHELVYHF